MIDVTASKKKRTRVVIAVSVVLVLLASAITYYLMAENNESLNNGREIVLNNQSNINNEPLSPEAAEAETAKAASYYLKYKELIDAERLRLSEVMAANFADPAWRHAKMERAVRVDTRIIPVLERIKEGAGQLYIADERKWLDDRWQPGLGETLIPVFEGGEFDDLRTNASPAVGQQRSSTLRERVVQMEYNNNWPDPYLGYRCFIKVLDTAGYDNISTDRRGYILYLPIDEAFSYLSDDFKEKLFSEKELAQWFIYNNIIKERIVKQNMNDINGPFTVYRGGGGR